MWLRWAGLLQVLVVVFGQELPEASASLVDQTFSLLVAFVGLATFALVLALVEQVVLEVLDSLNPSPRSAQQSMFLTYRAGHVSLCLCPGAGLGGPCAPSIPQHGRLVVIPRYP